MGRRRSSAAPSAEARCRWDHLAGAGVRHLLVYFGREETFDRDDVLAPVLHKEPAGDRVVCYCFAVTEKDLGREIVETGRSRVAAEIAVHVKAERCACEVKNPQGSCCLGNLASALAALL